MKGYQAELPLSPYPASVPFPSPPGLTSDHDQFNKEMLFRQGAGKTVVRPLGLDRKRLPSTVNLPHADVGGGIRKGVCYAIHSGVGRLINGRQVCARECRCP